jgi:hypothetical protein
MNGVSSFAGADRRGRAIAVLNDAAAVGSARTIGRSAIGPTRTMTPEWPVNASDPARVSRAATCGRVDQRPAPT